MNNNILVIGSINQDMVVFAARHPQPGETILGTSFQSFPGGKGANQAIAAARLGGNVRMVGSVGNDPIGKQLLQNFSQSKVDISKIRKVDAPTGTALVTVAADGQNSIVVVPGANASITPDDVDSLTAEIQSANIVVLQLEIPLEVVIRAIDFAYLNKVTTILNPAPAARISEETLRKISYLILNESELAFLSGLPTKSEGEIQKAAKQIFALGCKQMILTLGKKGAFYLSPRHKIFAPAFEVKAVDTTAAGDAFIGSFATSLANNLDLQSALTIASAAGALTVTKAGAQSSLPTKEELDAFLKTHT